MTHGGSDDYDADELRLLAMLEHPHHADAIADLPDSDIEDAIAEHAEDQ